MRARHLVFVGMALAAVRGGAQLPALQTNVMTFQHLEQSGTGLFVVGPCVRESGMILSTLSAEGHANDFVTWRMNDSYCRGSAALANERCAGTTVLSRTNGAAFDFLGLDLTGFQSFNQGLVTFLGFRGFDFVGSETFIYEGGRFQTFRTSRLTNVTEVRWEQSCPAAPQFDNVTVVLDAGAPAAQPVIQVRRGQFVLVDISGLRVNTSYALEYAAEPGNWICERTFRSSSTINFPGFLSRAVPTNRFYRVRGL